MAPAAQIALFGGDEPRFDAELTKLRRIDLGDGAWVEHLPGWVEGEARLFAELRAALPWREAERPMYDRVVEVPRLMADLPGDGGDQPVVRALAAALACRYGGPFDRVQAHLYRDGRDSVAMHADRVARDGEVAPLPIVSLGEPRRFRLRPRERGVAAPRSFQLGWGDLFVMGPRCLVEWEHGVPKVAEAGERLSLMFRRGRYR